jgi:hypothetical protein
MLMHPLWSFGVNRSGLYSYRSVRSAVGSNGAPEAAIVTQTRQLRPFPGGASSISGAHPEA